jgi:hypothetical protein
MTAWHIDRCGGGMARALGALLAGAVAILQADDAAQAAKLFELLELKAGMAIADIGAGRRDDRADGRTSCSGSREAARRRAVDPAGRRSTSGWKGESDVRFMMLLKADRTTEAGVLPSRKDLEVMGTFNGELVKAGVLLDAAGLQPNQGDEPAGRFALTA